MRVLEISRRYFAIWKHLAAISIKQRMQYTQNVYVRFLSRIVSFIVYIVFLDIVYGLQHSFQGWTKIDMLLLLGVYRAYLSIAESVLFANIRILGETIYFATIDKYLIKPVSTIFLASFEKVHIYDIFDALIGFIFIGYALSQQTYHLTLFSVGAVLLTLLLTTILFAAIILSVMSLAFHGSRVDNAYWILDDLLKISALPSSLHGPGWDIAFKFILPITLFASVPVEIIKGLFDSRLLAVYLLITIAWVFIASRLWKDGLKRYTGAG